MSRIRSVHPGIFTDESFMAISMAARVALFGLWTEADDHGVFAWKPLTLKARILPADNVDMAALLAELAENNFLQSFMADDRQYGIIRNFRKFQRPKKPTYANPFPPEFATYIGLPKQSSEPVGNPSGTGGRKSPQMEDGEKEKEEGDNTSSLRSDVCTQPPAADVPEASSASHSKTKSVQEPEIPAFIAIPTNRFETAGEEIPISEAKVAEYEQTYPAVNVRQQLRAARQWSIDNRNQRKTRKGIPKFVNGWLAREQNKANKLFGGNYGSGNSQDFGGNGNIAYEDPADRALRRRIAATYRGGEAQFPI